MSKPQNPLIKLLQQLGLARFLGLAPSNTDDAKAASVEQPKPAPPQEAPAVVEKPVVSSVEPAVAEAPASPVETATPVSPVVIDDVVAEPVATAAVAASTSAAPVIPEDSVLNRHYQANQQAEREAITHPYPSDSVLRRHYDTEHKLAQDVPPAVVTASVVVDDAPHVEEPQPVETAVVEHVVVKSAPSPVAQVADCKDRVRMPQDSVLKRHFLQCLQAEIEASLQPAPTDSVLRRHHAALIQSELEKRLAH